MAVAAALRRGGRVRQLLVSVSEEWGEFAVNLGPEAHGVSWDVPHSKWRAARARAPSSLFSGGRTRLHLCRQRALAVLGDAGALLEAPHDVAESYSHIVAHLLHTPGSSWSRRGHRGPEMGLVESSVAVEARCRAERMRGVWEVMLGILRGGRAADGLQSRG